MNRIRAVITVEILAVCMAVVPAEAKVKETVEVPQEVAAIAEELGEEYGICPELIQAIAWRESRFKSDAENKGCIGIMQVYEKWHKDRMKRLGVTDLYDMRQNMMVGVDFLSELFERYGDAPVVTAAYHGEKDIYDVSDYTKTIIELTEYLERKHGKIE